MKNIPHHKLKMCLICIKTLAGLLMNITFLHVSLVYLAVKVCGDG